METIWRGIEQALILILSMDRQVYSIVLLSLIVTFSSAGISTIVGIPIGCIIGLNNFCLKKAINVIIHTMMGLPPVIAGLVVFLFLSRSGPLGSLDLLFTPTAMVIAQVILITPIVTGLTTDIVSHKGKDAWLTARTLGANTIQSLWVLLRELRIPLMSAVVAGFGRGISEVGAVILVGGNIKGYTRMMTTAIVLETGKGNFDLAIAIGVILLLISLIINILLYKLQSGVKDGHTV
jgi:tungstate transport system permease protein